jgi:mercuric ion transport protein
MKSENKLMGAGLITAMTASLCCITPVLALIAGTSGMASTFSWIEPFRPYLIGLTIFVLGFAWYQKLKPKKEMDCECETDEKPKFMQSKTFLGIVTVFAGVMLALPYYSGIFYPNTEKQIIAVDKSDIKITTFKINGIVHSKASYESGNAIIEFDKTKTNETEIAKAINSTGYIVTDKKEN